MEERIEVRQQCVADEQCPPRCQRYIVAKVTRVLWQRTHSVVVATVRVEGAQLLPSLTQLRVAVSEKAANVSSDLQSVQAAF